MAGNQGRGLGRHDEPAVLTGVPTPGDRIVNTDVVPSGNASNIYTTEKFGDVEVYVEFMIAAHSNSGFFLHGLYETQIWDSWGFVPRLMTDQCGSMYHYNGGPINGEDGGIGPKARADRPPGQWQSYHYWFQAPKFDASGKKTANAKFIRILHNGQLIHENVERRGPTAGSHEHSRSGHEPDHAPGRSRRGGVSQHLHAAPAPLTPRWPPTSSPPPKMASPRRGGGRGGRGGNPAGPAPGQIVAASAERKSTHAENVGALCRGALGLCGVLACAASFAFAQSKPIPQLVKKGDKFTLMVDGKPFIMMGGQVGNFSALSGPHGARLAQRSRR